MNEPGSTRNIAMGLKWGVNGLVRPAFGLIPVFAVVLYGIWSIHEYRDLPNPHWTKLTLWAKEPALYGLFFLATTAVLRRPGNLPWSFTWFIVSALAIWAAWVSAVFPIVGLSVLLFIGKLSTYMGFAYALLFGSLVAGSVYGILLAILEFVGAIPFSAQRLLKHIVGCAVMGACMFLFGFFWFKETTQVIYLPLVAGFSVLPHLLLTHPWEPAAPRTRRKSARQWCFLLLIGALSYGAVGMAWENFRKPLIQRETNLSFENVMRWPLRTPWQVVLHPRPGRPSANQPIRVGGTEAAFLPGEIYDWRKTKLYLHPEWKALNDLLEPPTTVVLDRSGALIRVEFQPLDEQTGKYVCTRDAWPDVTLCRNLEDKSPLWLDEVLRNKRPDLRLDSRYINNSESIVLIGRLDDGLFIGNCRWNSTACDFRFVHGDEVSGRIDVRFTLELEDLPRTMPVASAIHDWLTARRQAAKTQEGEAAPSSR